MKLLIDFGSSNIKYAVTEGEIPVDIRSVPAPDFIYSPEGNREIDILSYSREIRKIIESAYDKYSVDEVYICSQMHGMILFAGNKRALIPFISWQDRRAESVGSDGLNAIEYIAKTVSPEIIDLAGERLRYSHSLCQLITLRRGDIRCCARLAMLPDAICEILTGKEAPVHPTMAASTGMYNIKSGTWNFSLLEKLNLLNITPPQIVKDNEPCGIYSYNNAEIKLYPAIGDHQAAVLGVAPGKNEVVVNVGTGAQATIVSEGIRTDDSVGTRPYFGGEYLNCMSHLPGGGFLDMLSAFADDASGNNEYAWDKINASLSDVTDSGGISFTDENTMKLSDGDKKAGNIYYAAYDYMAREYAKAVETLHGSSVVCSGGAVTKSPKFREILSKYFQNLRIATPNESLYGLVEYIKLLHK